MAEEGFLRDYQLDAVKRLHNGAILVGGVGSGKTRTALAWYYISQGGSIDGSKFTEMKGPKDLLVITTARKRDSGDWEAEMAPFGLSPDPKLNKYGNEVTVTSWNQIKKFEDVKDSVILLDEQRLLGYGTWSKTFIKMAKRNTWIMLSATPADRYEDLMVVFICNGFYKNKTDFYSHHCEMNPYTKFPQIKRYHGVQKLERLRSRVLVTMQDERTTERHYHKVSCDYDVFQYKMIGKERWNPYTNKPIRNVSELCQTWRRIANSDPSRGKVVLRLLESYHRIIVFYSYDFERDILLHLKYPKGTKIAEWSGHAHEPVPREGNWVYLAQYTAAAEAWNCVTTNCVVFYSMPYSYRMFEQASGRIDRMNTSYHDLYYYTLTSSSKIDLAIARCLRRKKTFSETRFVKRGR